MGLGVDLDVENLPVPDEYHRPDPLLPLSVPEFLR